MTKTHATGSAATYAIRYLTKMIFNIATVQVDDDDGNRASGKAKGAKIINGDVGLSTKQMDTLRGLIEETMTDEVKLCVYISKIAKRKIESVTDCRHRTSRDRRAPQAEESEAEKMNWAAVVKELEVHERRNMEIAINLEKSGAKESAKYFSIIAATAALLKMALAAGLD